MSNWGSQNKEIEEKSKLFLNRIMGNERFIRFQKDGKIEFEVISKENEKIIYELDRHGRVVNKTKNQSYCIVAGKLDYPINDLIAIKYAYLIHGNEIAEKVANKSKVYGNGTSPSYLDYVDYLETSGWNKEKIIIDELCEFTRVESAEKDSTTRIVYFKCPYGQKISLMGRQQVPMGADDNIAYKLKLNITDENGNQIPDDTKIRISKNATSDYVIQLARIYYSDLKDGSYTFTHGVEVNDGIYFEIYVVNNKCNIPKENIKFDIEADLWTKVID